MPSLPEIHTPGEQVWVYFTITSEDAINLTPGIDFNPTGLIDATPLIVEAEAPDGSVVTLSAQHRSLGVYRAALRLAVPDGQYTVRVVGPSGPGDSVGETYVQVGRSPFVP
jgi:hypothetical protein